MKFLLAAVNAKYIHSNPGVYSLKKYAEATVPHMQTEIAEYTINHSMDQVLQDLYLRKPDIIGFSCYIWNMMEIRGLIHDLHKVLPDTDIWLGGPEVSFDAPEMLKQEPEVLGVMKGEGERTFAKLLGCYRLLGCSVRSMTNNPPGETDADNEESRKNFWREMHNLPGIAYRMDHGEIEDREIRPAADLSIFPFPYEELTGFENRIIYYESSRGCPFSCSYCLSSVDKVLRFRDLELVKKELDFFLERKVPQVKFVDRTFNCKKSHAMAIWRYILERDNGVTNFHFEVAADLMDQEELELIGKMRQGQIQLEIGVQSTNPRTIREIRRRMDLEKVRQVVARIHAGHNVHQHLDLIAGLPFEDYESFRHSFNEVYEMEPEQLQLGFLKVLKGSHMYEMASRYQLVYRQEAPYEVLSTRWLSYAEVIRLKGVEAMVEVYYNSGQFVNTLRLLAGRFSDAFGMFERLAQYYEDCGWIGRNHSRLARYEILHDFIQMLEQEPKENEGQAGPGISMENWEDALVCDCYLRENCKSRPGFAREQSAYKEKFRSLVPELRSLGSQVHIEALHSGEIWLFDYRKRDPLTRNAAMIRLE